MQVARQAQENAGVVSPSVKLGEATNEDRLRQTGTT